MPEADLNMLVNGFKGSFDKLVLKKYRGRTIISKRPVFTKAPTEKQIAQREHFIDASEYGKLAMEDPTLRAYYEPVAQDRNRTIYVLAMGDYLSKPRIRSLDVSEYKGQAGNTIEIVTADNIGVVEVQVRISDGDRDLESGAAVQSTPRHWTYTAKTSITFTEPEIIVTAKDRPGGVAVQNKLMVLD